MQISEQYPYQHVVGDLLASTMRAQASLLKAYFEGKDITENVFAGEINKHFSWLAIEYEGGVNRHFFDAPESLRPLRTSALRSKKSLPPEVQLNLENRMPPDHGIAAEKYERLQSEFGKRSTRASAKTSGSNSVFWQQDPTRISELIRRALYDDIRESVSKRSKAKDSGRQEEEFGFSLRSPLAIVYDFLTIPDMPGSRAYALMAVRNLLFSELGIVPDLAENALLQKSQAIFGVRDIEGALSRVWTSLRPRHESLGADKLPVRQLNADTLVRHFLAMKGALRFRFVGRDGKSKCLKYLSSAGLLGDKTATFEVEKAEQVERLPETGELVNELFGLPLPIRGADTVFRGGLKFSTRRGLVMAIHGEPGTGKTSLALAFGAYLAPFGIRTLFLTGEEEKADLISRIEGLVPDAIRRLDFFPDNPSTDIRFSNPFRPDDRKSKLDLSNENVDRLTMLERKFYELTEPLRFTEDAQDKAVLPSEKSPPTNTLCIPKACRAVVVLDGLHDVFASSNGSRRTDQQVRESTRRLYDLIETARNLQALVILTTGREWAGDAMLDYLVDVAMHLTLESMGDYGAKPNRTILLSKARYQLCATGVHGFQLAGSKGVRFSPQVNYQLDRRSLWKMRLPDRKLVKKVLIRVANDFYGPTTESRKQGDPPRYRYADESVQNGALILGNSHIFINGQGSGGKAALALKIAIAPSFVYETPGNLSSLRLTPTREKVLVVSFLYPKEYYEDILTSLKTITQREYQDYRVGKQATLNFRMDVIHLYPGHLKPNELYNRIEWKLDEAELNGDPYTSVIIDGIHNVFLQFPLIENYKLFWTQVFNSLRSRPIMSITTHTTLTVPTIIRNDRRPLPVIDDNRSEPLRHALVQKTDFQIEVEPYDATDEDNNQSQRDPRDAVPHDSSPGLFMVKAVAAIGQAIPRGYVLWSREEMLFFSPPKRAP